MHLHSNYQAASIVAPHVERHFRDSYLRAQAEAVQHLAKPPNAQVVEQMIDTAFWASLRREEGNAPKISMAYLSSEQAEQPMMLEKSIPFTAANLTKMASGVERAGIHLGIWHEGEQLCIWGITLSIPDLCFVLDVSEPGLLVVKHRSIRGVGKFANVAVVMGDQVKILDRESMRGDDQPPMLSSLLGFEAASGQSVNILLQLAVSMRSHRHGGALLIVPAESEDWRESILHPIKHGVKPKYRGLACLAKPSTLEEREDGWQDKIRSQVSYIGGLTAIDGATLINDRYELLAFGAKIGRRKTSPTVSQLYSFEPVMGQKPVILHPSQNGGTRHLSACQFVYDQRDALALVASQDGQFSVFFWSEKQQMVKAYLLESLLL